MLDLDLHLALVDDLRERLRSDDSRVSTAANRDYERCARAPEGFAAALASAPAHVAAAQAALRSKKISDDWQLDFLKSIQRFRNPSEKQLSKLEEICGRAGVKWRTRR
jgi:hypothetical protein